MGKRRKCAMPLTEFLLARIAEDEAMLRGEGDYLVSFNLPRLLRECEAKRQIVEIAEDHADSADPIGHRGTMYFIDDYQGVLLALAAIYADHPDYQFGWRSA